MHMKCRWNQGSTFSKREKNSPINRPTPMLQDTGMCWLPSQSAQQACHPNKLPEGAIFLLVVFNYNDVKFFEKKYLIAMLTGNIHLPRHETAMSNCGQR